MKLSDLKDAFKPKITCSAVVVAAGSSQRFGCDKLFALLGGIPVLAYSLATLESCDYITEIVVVTECDKITQVAQLCADYNINKASKIVCGGQTRLESALSGVSETDKNVHLIAIHDGARPLVTRAVIDGVIEAAYRHKAAVPGIASRDTVKIVKDAFVTETPDRKDAFTVQTPQVFVPELIKGALTNALQKALTAYDDASAVEMLGFPVFISEGSEENLKITTPLDLRLAETILAVRRERALL